MLKKPETQKPKGLDRPKISRRRMLLSLGAALAGMAAASCRRLFPQTAPATLDILEPTSTSAPSVTATPRPSPLPPSATATPTPTWTPMATPTSLPPTVTATSTTLPAATLMPSPTVAPTTAYSASVATRVAVGRASSYYPAMVRQEVESMLDNIGGLSDVIRAGDKVALKVNLTGGMYFTPPAGYNATESYMTHPQVVRALCELLRDAGAADLFIVESVFDDVSYSAFGYVDIAQAVGATLIDLNQPAPYSGFVNAPVGAGAFIYEAFVLNPILVEVDAFVSVAKMKCHFNAGVTHAMKNLIGLVPVSQYRLDSSHWWRSALHGGDAETPQRLPRVIVDLNRARPIDLAFIDGIKTGEGGETPRGSFNPVAPGLMVAGKDPVATDAVATALMGFDPTVEPPQPPFLRGDNYLNLAAAYGMGTNRLGDITVAGTPIEDGLFPFNPSTTL